MLSCMWLLSMLGRLVLYEHLHYYPRNAAPSSAQAYHKRQRSSCLSFHRSLVLVGSAAHNRQQSAVLAVHSVLGNTCTARADTAGIGCASKGPQRVGPDSRGMEKTRCVERSERAQSPGCTCLRQSWACKMREQPHFLGDVQASVGFARVGIRVQKSMRRQPIAGCIAKQGG
jgi:hypothetical protein